MLCALAAGIAVAAVDGKRLREGRACLSSTTPLLAPLLGGGAPFPSLATSASAPPFGGRLGTHNSYRRASSLASPPPAWRIEQPPLDTQVALGARCFELDLHYGALVYHVATLDERSHCRCVFDCLEALTNATSDTLWILLELKDDFDTRFWRLGFGDGALAAIDALAAAFVARLGTRLFWPRDLVATLGGYASPDDTLRDALARAGAWPSATAAPLQGCVVLVLMGESVYALPRHDARSPLSARTTSPFFVMFQNGSAALRASEPQFAITTVTEPWSPEIDENAALGVAVRTYGDDSNYSFNSSRLLTAFSSRASFVTTDFLANATEILSNKKIK